MCATSSFLRSPDATDQASSALCSFIELCRGTLSTGCKRVYDRIHRSWSDLAVIVLAPSLPSVNSLFRNQIADWLGYSSLSNCTSSQVVNPILQVVDLVNTSNLCFIQLLCSCVRTTVQKIGRQFCMWLIYLRFVAQDALLSLPKQYRYWSSSHGTLLKEWQSAS